MMHKVCIHIVFCYRLIINPFQDVFSEEEGPPAVISQPKPKPPENLPLPKPETIKQETHDEASATRFCNCSKPHDKFPGIEHYFEIRKNKPSLSSSIQRKPISDLRTTSSADNGSQNEEGDENVKESGEEYNDDDDDDNHVISDNAFAKK